MRAIMGLWLVILASLLLALGCDDGNDLVKLSLRTDLVAGVDFDEASAIITLPDEEVLEASVSPQRGQDLIDLSLPLLESELALGSYDARVTLSNVRGEVLSRSLTFDVFREATVSVVLTTDCLGVECEDGQACFRGTCVSDMCSSADWALCGPPECNVDDDCESMVGRECEVPVCIDGWCLPQRSPGLCEEGEYCSERGCTAL